MANTGNLKGMACPECGHEGPFRITCEVLAYVSDRKVNVRGPSSFDADSWCNCPECDFSEVVREFEAGGEAKAAKEKAEGLPQVVGCHLSAPLRPTAFN